MEEEEEEEEDNNNLFNYGHYSNVHNGSISELLNVQCSLCTCRKLSLRMKNNGGNGGGGGGGGGWNNSFSNLMIL